MKLALSLSTLMLAGGILAAPATVYAAGGDSGTPVTTCPSGQVYSEQKKMCVPQQSGIVDDQTLVDTAWALSREGRFEDALAALDLLQDPNTPVALNYRGYATRKLGRIDEGIGYYLQSVALDPDYTLVREYLGEAYVIKGDFVSAREQLGEIEKRCGTTCEPYHDLAEAIEAAI
jgi:tetratricopeptide (TPR) repeat protein